MTPAILGRMLRKFQTDCAPYFRKAKGYYDGRGQAIMSRVISDSTRPNNKIVKNYCATITDNFQGFLTGQPITYSAKDDCDISPLLDILEDNDIVNTDSNFLKTALINGVAYELCYVNENNEKRFKNIEPEQVLPIYANDLDEDLLYCVYFYPIINWDDDDFRTSYAVNLYTESEVFHYVTDEGFNSFTIAAEPEQHYFNEVPFVIFNLNEDNSSIFERIISLQDAYNKLLSDEVNDFEAFVDCYMVLKNVAADAEDLQAMKESRTILIDGEDDVTYLTKDINDTQIENLLNNLNASIHTISNSPDFSSEEFNQGVSSGIALQYKLVGFSNVAANIEAQMRKALNKRIDLLNSIFRLVDSHECEIEIVFSYNLPSNISDTVSMVNTLRGLVSDETLLAQIPFIQDVPMELERVQAQKLENMEVYSFSNHTTEEVSVDEEEESEEV